MQGLKVQCPNCKRTDFVTTAKFNPDATPNGGMVKCALPYHIDWLCSSTTLCAEMTCPECLCQLAPSGVLNVLVPLNMVGEIYQKYFSENINQKVADDIFRKKVIVSDEVPEDTILFIPPLSTGESVSDLAKKAVKVENVATQEEQLTCPICNDGRVFKSKIALKGHMSSHEKKGK